MDPAVPRQTGSKPAAPLAIDGGPPAFPAGPPSWPIPNDQVLQSLQDIYRSQAWGHYQSDVQRVVEECVANLTEQTYVRLCSSGTIAVELALRAAGVKAGDEVILAGYDFAGNFRSIEACQAVPLVIDINCETYCLDPTQLPTAIRPHTSAMIVSHLHGGLAPMKSLVAWAADHNVTVIEDACQAPGAYVDGRPAGSWGDASILSFGGSKLLTAGRGGAVATNRPEVHQRMKIFADRGNDAFPLSVLQSAVLPCQFEILAALNNQRRASAKILRDVLADESLIQTIDIGERIDNQPSYYKYSLLLSPDRFDATLRTAWIGAIQAEGIACDAGFRGFAKRGSRRCRKIGDLPNSRLISELGVVLHHPVLLQDKSTIERVADTICRVTHAMAARQTG